MTDAEQGPRHWVGGVPNWISAGAAVVAALGGIAFGVANLGSSSETSSPPTTTMSVATNVADDEDEPTLSRPRIVTVERDPPPVVSASGTAENLPVSARIHLGVRTIPAEDATRTGTSEAASGAETSAWQLSARGVEVADDGTWKVPDFQVPESVQEPYEFFAIATTIGGAGLVQAGEGSGPRRCTGLSEKVSKPPIFLCEEAKSPTVRYTPR